MIRRGAVLLGPPCAVIALAALLRWITGDALPGMDTRVAVAGDLSAGVALVEAVRSGRVVDLTWAFDADTVYWPTEEGFELEKEHDGLTPGGYFYAANRLRTAEHGGTHMDAPVHFSESGLPVDRVPLASLVGPTAVVDVSASAAADRDYRLTVADLERWEERHGRLPAGAIVVMRSGWGARWPDKERYLGTAKPDDTANLHFPGFSKEAAEWLVRERDVAAIAVDTPSIDHGPSQDFIVHRVINGANKPAFENLANAERLPESGAVLIALPMKIAGGSGAPARILAVLP